MRRLGECRDEMVIQATVGVREGRDGVKEFWLISPVERLIRVNKLGKDGRFEREEIYDETAEIAIAQFAGLSIDCRRLFPPLPNL